MSLSPWFRPRRLGHAVLEFDRPHDVTPTVQKCASPPKAVTGLSRYELARQFRASYGTSPYRYSLMRRLDFARNRLRDGMPLAELALAAGFADQAHFTRMFRSAFGVTPGRYARLRFVGWRWHWQELFCSSTPMRSWPGIDSSSGSAGAAS